MVTELHYFSSLYITFISKQTENTINSNPHTESVYHWLPQLLSNPGVVIVTELVPLREVATYRAYINVTATIARSIGGPIGAWIAGSTSWRW